MAGEGLADGWSTSTIYSHHGVPFFEVEVRQRLESILRICNFGEDIGKSMTSGEERICGVTI